MRAPDIHPPNVESGPSGTVVGRRLRAVLGRGLDLLLPPRCLACGEFVDRQGKLCAACWSGVNFIGPPMCRVCGAPFDYDPGGELVCAACLARPPGYDRARAALRYDAASAALILGLKYRDRTDAASAFAGWMARAGAELLEAADIVAPVPLHWRRLFARRYNQAALLALGIARLSQRHYCPDLLAKTRARPSQRGLDRLARARNVRGSLCVAPRHLARVDGRCVVLIDDVLTTGATADECARLLKEAGAAGVDVLVLGRALGPANIL